MEYDFTIIHRKGALHHVPDALSRAPESLVIEKENIRRMQPTEDHIYCHRPTEFIAVELDDLDAWKLVLPRELRSQALSESHTVPQAGHLGVDKTYRRLSNKYYWPSQLRDVVTFVNHCDTCQRCKVKQRPPAGFMGRRVIEEPWITVAADIMGPLTKSRSGFAYILVIQDLFSKWIEVVPLRRANGKKISNSLYDLVICRWGAPRVLVTDNGTEFINRDVGTLTERTGIRHNTTPPYHPQANPVERVNRVLKIMLRAFVDGDQRYWDTHLVEFRFAFNTAHHSSLQTTPAFANLGRERLSAVSMRREIEGDLEIVPRPPLEWVERMKRLETLRNTLAHALGVAQNQQAHYYNLRRRNREFEEGDLVLRRAHPLSSAAKHYSAALAKPFEGPFVISKKLSRMRYELTNLAGQPRGVSSVQDLKPYTPPLDANSAN